ncbi:MAG: carbonic anhydrase [Bdellovibrionales bacterium]|nr:carbonic anhydrase [Bdellovibrionales bacterium]
MKKLIAGVVEFRQKRLPDFRDTFAKLALGQSPDTFYVTCSDSRVAVNVFASTNPGDLFVMRNVGNLIPPCDIDGFSKSDESEGAAIEFALGNLNVSDIIICGHSECGAMRAVMEGRANVTAPHLKRWLRHGEAALEDFRKNKVLPGDWAPHNQLSQLNVLKQIENLRTYPDVQERLAAGKLRLHGWWFDIANAEVYAYEPEFHRFTALDEKEAQRILDRMNS